MVNNKMTYHLDHPVPCRYEHIWIHLGKQLNHKQQRCHLEIAIEHIWLEFLMAVQWHFCSKLEEIVFPKVRKLLHLLMGKIARFPKLYLEEENNSWNITMNWLSDWVNCRNLVVLFYLFSFKFWNWGWINLPCLMICVVTECSLLYLNCPYPA